MTAPEANEAMSGARGGGVHKIDGRSGGRLVMVANWGGGMSRSIVASAKRLPEIDSRECVCVYVLCVYA